MRGCASNDKLSRSLALASSFKEAESSVWQD